VHDPPGGCGEVGGGRGRNGGGGGDGFVHFFQHTFRSIQVTSGI